jgi:hypothetical protein
MIVAIRNPARYTDVESLQQRIDALKAFYGIDEQRLENLLA